MLLNQNNLISTSCYKAGGPTGGKLGTGFCHSENASIDPLSQIQDLISIRPVNRINPPFAGVTAVYAVPEAKSSTCTMVLPICFCHQRITSPSRTTTASYSTVSENPVLSPAIISTRGPE